jgi:hypothetical protein
MANPFLVSMRTSGESRAAGALVDEEGSLRAGRRVLVIIHEGDEGLSPAAKPATDAP